MASFKAVCEVIAKIDEINSTIRHICNISAGIGTLKQLDENETAALENACDELKDYVDMLKTLPISRRGGME